jgi:hypothetical protein
MRPEPLVCPSSSNPHQLRIARHIGGEDRGETADSGHWSPGTTEVPNQFIAKLTKLRHRWLDGAVGLTLQSAANRKPA